jgi:hypothetical protein
MRALLRTSLAASLFGALTLASFGAPAAEDPKPAPPPPPAAPSAAPAQPGSLATMAPLGEGRIGLRLGGGIAVLLPFYGIEVGYGLGRVDLVGRIESVVGVLHYPSIGVRYSPFDIGSWKAGLAFAANYSFFGIKTDNVNLTSTFYLSGEAGISGPVTKATDLMFAVGNEVDFFDYKNLDGKGSFQSSVHYDTLILIMGLKSRLTEDLDGYVRGRVRIPVETFRYEATNLYVVPFLEVGGTFDFATK